MTRLQKKCLIAVAGTHLLVIVAIFCSGFVRPTPKPDNTDVLNVIPANLVDAVLNSGVKNAPTPPPTPPAPQPPQPVATPPPPPPQPAPPTPKQETIIDKIENALTPDQPVVQETPTPTVENPKPKPVHHHEINLKLVTHNVPMQTHTEDNSAEQAREEKQARDARRKAINDAARAIEHNASSATTVEMPGNSSVSYANYASVVKSIYERSWIAPDSSASDDANAKVSVTISSDGRVTASSIITSSGDASVDASVQRTLDRVTFIAPFPEGATERERTFIINFNLKAKRMFG